MPDDHTVLTEGVRIIFRNFRGEERRFNPEGKRTFAVVIDDDSVANAMLNDGWNVKYLDPREEEEGETPTAFLPVVLKYDGGRPPRVIMVTSRNRVNLDESDIEQLDQVDIVNVDLIVRPYSWTMPNGNTGITAYLKSMYVTIEEDALDLKYADLKQAKH